MRRFVLDLVSRETQRSSNGGGATYVTATEFLPAALEIQETPVSPVGRAMLWTIVAVFLTATVWATVGKVDVVAVAPGKIIPNGHSKTIQPFEAGVVAAIHVQDGQVVRQGDLLIELDPTQQRADRDRVANEYRAVLVEAARLRALIAGDHTFATPPGAASEFVTLQRQMLREQAEEFRARLDAARHLVDQRQAVVDATKDNVARLEATVPIEAERAKAYQSLLVQQYVSRMDYLQFEQQRIDRAQELAGQKNKLRQDRAALSEAEETYHALVAEFQRTYQSELASLETKAASLLQEVRKADQRTDLQKLVSPIDGVVQQLAIHTVGGVVTPAQPLLLVVPQDHPIEVEARFENRDIGFVREGQEVEIKVDTFPFTLYGTIPGKVLSVSDDAVPLEKEQGGLVYVGRVGMDRTTMVVEGKEVHLTPGMAVVVEVKTGRRRVIQYLLSPLLKSIGESLRER